MDDEHLPDKALTNSANRAKLTSDSYKQAVQSSDNLFQLPLPQGLSARRQEAKFYVQQLLTDLIALGVLEYESGFENAINKTFKVSGGCLGGVVNFKQVYIQVFFFISKPKSEYSWGRFLPVSETNAASQTPGKLTIWPPQDSTESISSLEKSFALDTSKIYVFVIKY